MSLNTILATTPLTSTNYVLKATGTTIGNSLIWDNGTNVGIGNTNTSYTLDVSGTGRFTGALTAASGAFGSTSISSTTIQNIGNFYIGTSAANFIQFYTNNTDRMIITSAGNVGIGTASPLTNFTLAGENAVTDSFGQAYIYTTDAQAIDKGGQITLGGLFSTSRTVFASIAGRKTNGSSGDSSGYLSFGTNSGSAITERMRITSGGYLNSTMTYGNTTANAANMVISAGGTFERSTSSIRYKTNVEDLNIDTTNILSKMRPIWYRSKTQNDRKDWSWYGFIAEELAEIEPRLVQWGYDKTSYEIVETNDEEGNTRKETKLKEDAVLIPDGVQYERITVLLVAEIQKMNQTIQNLQEQINILAK